MAALFRAIGAHHLDHFTLAILHGLCLDFLEPEWQLKVGSLYPVTEATKIPFTEHYIDMNKLGETVPDDFSEAKGTFCSANFPETYESWKQTVLDDPSVRTINSKNLLRISPMYGKDEVFTTGYSDKNCYRKLKSIPSRADPSLMKFEMKAVNLNGCLLSSLAKFGRKNNISVVLAIKDYCDKLGSLVPKLPDAIKSIITSFVQAVIVAGLCEGESFGLGQIYLF